MNIESLFDGIGGFPLAFQRAGAEVLVGVEIDPRPVNIVKRRQSDGLLGAYPVWTSPPAGRARGTRRQASATASETIARRSGGRSSAFSEMESISGFLGRMCPDFSLSMTDSIFLKYSVRWTPSGMALHGGCWTLSTSGSPRDAKESSLSDILEDLVHPKYFLSPKAANGILRRALKRGRILPAAIRAALEELGAMSTEDFRVWRDRLAVELMARVA
jgi:hypothetical protein